jgi:hypothetical protein
MRLSDADRALIEATPFDPAASVAYNEITGALAWSDELPDGLSQAGHADLRELLAIRGYLHRGLPVDTIPRHEAVASGIRWNGFRRLALTPDQRAVLQGYIEDDAEL